MEEETKKRNTDCLYFLASPLTCKKGSECEYRHSDSARINPRDCWYWLNGNCRNPNCAFRHTPLEGFNGVKADSFYTPSFSTVPTKSNVPCYFYFNSVCAKGEQCPFLHEAYITQKLVSKSVPEPAVAANPPQNKISTDDSGPGFVELPVNPPKESVSGPTKLKEDSCSPLAEPIIPEFEEPPADNPLPSIEFMDRAGQLSPYSSSEELLKECVDQEIDERWESSPGFDVLVDDGSEQLAYEDDAEYQLVQSRDYDFEGSAGYEQSAYPDSGYLFNGLYENYDHSDDIFTTSGSFRKISELPIEERLFEPMFDDCGKQRRPRRVHKSHDRNAVMGLQYQLRMDGRWMPSNSLKRRRCNPRSSSQERLKRWGMNGSIRSRLASQAGRRVIAANDQQGWRGGSVNSRFLPSRLREKERRRQRFPRISSEVQGSSARDEEESARISGAGFDGPKTLAQIKEERGRSKSEQNKNSLDHFPQPGRRRQAAGDFEGPKPLEELLKQKRSVGPQTRKLEQFDNAGSFQVNGSNDDNNDDNDGDDDDMFRKRLVHMLSQ